MGISYITILAGTTLVAIVGFGVYQLISVRRQKGQDTTSRINDFVERESK
ncbi:MAG: hypothetical protein AAFW46_05315 [Pseudomonadota bacterium]